MTKFFGKIGYAENVKTAPGVYTEQIVEKSYYGDVTKAARRLEGSSDSINDGISVSNTISIVADAYAYNHFFAIRYVEWAGCRWIVKTVEVQRPRLILSLGGVYNEDESSTSE
jgi:hypothetical protein